MSGTTCGNNPLLVPRCSACWSILPFKVSSKSGEGSVVFHKSWPVKRHNTPPERKRQNKREKERESHHPPPPSFPPFLPLTPRTRTRSGPRRHLWWAAASCWSRDRSSDRRARGLPRCGRPGPGAGPEAAGLSSLRHCASRGCIAAGRTLRRLRRTVAPGPGCSPRLSTATSARHYAPRPGTVSERTSGRREGVREEVEEREWKKGVNIYTVCMQTKVNRLMEWGQKRGRRERDGGSERCQNTLII